MPFELQTHGHLTLDGEGEDEGTIPRIPYKSLFSSCDYFRLTSLYLLVVQLCKMRRYINLHSKVHAFTFHVEGTEELEG